MQYCGSSRIMRDVHFKFTYPSINRGVFAKLPIGLRIGFLISDFGKWIDLLPSYDQFCHTIISGCSTQLCEIVGTNCDLNFYKHG